MNMNDRDLFRLRRARRCWYSREELKMLKHERKAIVRVLRKIHVDLNIDFFSSDARPAMLDGSTYYELRGLESYISPTIRLTTVQKRKNVVEAVLNEQDRQRRQTHDDDGKDDERLRLASQTGTEWFRHRALEAAKQDARNAREFCSEMIEPWDDYENEGIAMLDDSLHESFGLMDMDDNDIMDNNHDNSTLQYWANSSWTRNLMKE